MKIITLPARILLALLALSLVGACSEQAPYNALPPGSVVLAFGNSVTFGTGAAQGEDYPTQLAQKTGWQVINAGIPGDTAKQARERIETALAQHQPALVLVELGGNDFLRQRQPGAVKADLLAILLSIERHGAQALLIAVPRLSMLRASIGALEDSPIYRELAEETSVLLIDSIFSDVLSEEALRADRIHPNAAGYARFSDDLVTHLTKAGLLY